MAIVTIIRPKMALARLTSDSMASESRPTESVSHQAPVFRPMVTSATTTETSSRRWGVSQTAAAFMASAWLHKTIGGLMPVKSG